MTGVRTGHDRAVLEEERDFFLRSLRDLEAEWEAGDLDEVDYHTLRSDYTARAATVLRRIEALDALSLGEPALEGPDMGTPTPVAAPADGPAAPPDVAAEATPAPAQPGRLRSGRWRSGRWRSRRLAVALVVGGLVAAGLGWAVVAATGSRAPGGVATGQAVGQERAASLLQEAQAATAKGDGVTALKDLEAVLKQDPNQYVALSDEGWILAQTQQPQLLAQGIGLLSRAVSVQPGYAPARLYRGIAYLSEDDYAPAVADLQWYLGHGPDPQLVAGVDKALVTARAGAARVGTAQPAPSPSAGAPPTTAGR